MRKSLICKTNSLPNHVISNPKSCRGIAPVIATLLLVAISTIGGSMVFAYSQDSFNASQISSISTVEYLKIIGYDARDVDKLFLHDGNEILAKNCCGIADGKKNSDERIAIYVQNHSSVPVAISELIFSGEVYSFSPSSKIGEWDKIGNGHAPNQGEYVIVNRHIEGKNYDVVEDSLAVIESGGIVTILLDLEEGINMSHDTQIKITTVSGNVFVSSLQIGQTK